MSKFNNSKVLIDFVNIIDRMDQLGWDERNAGNVSMILDNKVIETYEKELKIISTHQLLINIPILKNRYLLVTGTGRYFKNMKSDPNHNCGIIKINDLGNAFDLVWGFDDEGYPTSEINTHLLVHAQRLSVDMKHRVVIHTHATHINALSMIFPLDERKMSRLLWKINTENIIIFPEGIGIIPWEVPGNHIIGDNTAKKIVDFRLVLWPLHGVVASGSCLDSTFGLVETAEKAAYVYLKVQGQPIINTITDKQLLKLAQAFHVQPNLEFLDLEDDA